MERKFLHDNWIDMRGQFSDWWDDLTEDDLDLVDGDEAHQSASGPLWLYGRNGKS